jgi:hypothetical protein
MPFWSKSDGKICLIKEDLRAGRATIDRPRPGRRSTIRQPYIWGEVFASSVPRRQYSKLSGVHQSEVFAARRLCARRKRPNQLREHSDSRSRIGLMRMPCPRAREDAPQALGGVRCDGHHEMSDLVSGLTVF